ncbi:MAG: hypothetical protein DMF16_06200 [Verrucomicrobia bacterium]|nr:MAG: hypothetical protein DMF16_06200 [Verrucomicrobiota bacterium]
MELPPTGEVAFTFFIAAPINSRPDRLTDGRIFRPRRGCRVAPRVGCFIPCDFFTGELYHKWRIKQSVSWGSSRELACTIRRRVECFFRHGVAETSTTARETEFSPNRTLRPA